MDSRTGMRVASDGSHVSSLPLCLLQLLILQRTLPASLFVKTILNTSTQRAKTSAKVAHYPHIAIIRELESQYEDPDHPKKLIIYSLYHRRAILKISSKSTHKLFSNVQIFCLTLSIWWSRSPPKFIHFTTPDPFYKIKFHRNLFMTFWVMFLTDRQTER